MPNEKLMPLEQHGVTTMQVLQRKHPERYRQDPLPTTQRWMCPACYRQHTDLPADVDHYRCACGWHGDRHKLCRGEL